MIDNNPDPDHTRISDICYCGHPRRSHFMGGSCYFPRIFDRNKGDGLGMQELIRAKYTDPRNKCQCREFRSNPELLV